MSNEFKHCPQCGKVNFVDDIFCKYCGAPLEEDIKSNEITDNIAQNIQEQVKYEVAPYDVANKFNWGAFLWTFIWCFAYKKYRWCLISIILLKCSFSFGMTAIGLLLIYLGVAVYIGTKGNTWAWQIKQYEFVEEFNSIQKKWIWVPFAILFPIVCIIALYLNEPALMNNTDHRANYNGNNENVLPEKFKENENISNKNDEKPLQDQRKFFGKYMKDLTQNIKKNWNPPRGEESKRVVLLFTIQRDGNLGNIKVVKSSGTTAADNAAIKAVKASAPFKPLPEKFTGNSVDIQFTFDYNVLGIKRY